MRIKYTREPGKSKPHIKKLKARNMPSPFLIGVAVVATALRLLSPSSAATFVAPIKRFAPDAPSTICGNYSPSAFRLRVASPKLRKHSAHGSTAVPAEEEALRKSFPPEQRSGRDAVKAARTLVQDLEMQREDIRLKIQELESAAQRVEQESLQAQGYLVRLEKDQLRAPFHEQFLGGETATAVRGSSQEKHFFDFPMVSSKVAKEPGLDNLRTISSSSNDTKTGLNMISETIGNGRYLLVGEPKKTTSGRSFIWTAYRSNEKGLPTGNALAIKVSTDIEAMQHENNNYELLMTRNRHSNFVDRVDFFPVDDEPHQINGEEVLVHQGSALVMQRGSEDLKIYLTKKDCGFEGETLRDISLSALKCLEDLHSSGLVWADLKTQNFVVFQEEGTESITIKGIDLESARPVKSHPIDFTPEGCPPEFARASVLGHASTFVLEQSYDVWSFGMFLFELALGKGFYDGKSLKYIVQMLAGALPGYKPTMEKISDPKLSSLISWCLESDPQKRPTVAEILAHPYFTK